MSNYTITTFPSPIAAPTPVTTGTLLSFYNYYDRDTNKLWKISVQTDDGRYMKQTAEFLQKTVHELKEHRIFENLTEKDNTLSFGNSVGEEYECRSNQKLLTAKISKSYFDRYIAALAIPPTFEDIGPPIPIAQEEEKVDTSDQERKENNLFPPGAIDFVNPNDLD